MKKEKIYRVNSLTSTSIFTNSKKIQTQLNKNLKKVIEETAFRVYWDKNK